MGTPGDRTVLVACNDAGGTRCVIPVARLLSERGHRVIGVAGGPAKALWKAEAGPLEIIEVDEDLSQVSATRHLVSIAPDLVLSACGAFNRMEHSFRQATRAADLPSIGVLDSWLNYAERFERDGVRCLPDVLCVDSGADRPALETLGFRTGQVMVTGQPQLEETIRQVDELRLGARDALRREMGAGPGDWLGVFFSDPFFVGPGRQPDPGALALVGPDGQSRLGYTPDEILDRVLGSLSRGTRRSVLQVKPHPREHPGALEEVLGRGSLPGVRAVLTTRPPRELLAAADGVFGMISITLLEAALSNLPAISVQIGLDEVGAADPCMATRLGVAHAVRSSQDLDPLVEALLVGEDIRLPAAGKARAEVEGAAGRVVAVVEELLGI